MGFAWNQFGLGRKKDDMTYLEQHRDEIFKKYTTEELKKDVFNYKNGKGKLTKFINQFFEECIFNCKDNRCKLTPMEALQNDEVMAKIIGAFAKNPKLYFGTEVQNVKKSLSVSGIGARKVSNFCPKNARSIYKRYFDDITGMNILDTSCGFGSRMLATLLNGANYYGFDPNQELFGKLKECHKWLVDNGEVLSTQVCDIHCQGSEEFVPELVGKMDMSFTSPPYFNHESYYNDEGNSTKNYNDYDRWLGDFVVPTLLNTYKYLKIGGLAMINIKNMVSRGKKPLYDDFMRTFQLIKGFEYVETFSMEIMHRTLHKDMNYVGFQEPVMVYKKVADCENDPDEIRKALHLGETPAKPPRKPRVKKEPAKTEYQAPFIQKLDEPEKPATPPPMFDIVVDEMDNIDPRSLGKLMVELKAKNVPLRIVHGQYDTDDVVDRLCRGLQVPRWPLRDASGFVIKTFNGTRKLNYCKAGEKPGFTKMEA